MAAMIYKSDFSFYEIADEFKENFTETSHKDLSDFHAEALRWAGDAIRPLLSEFFWNNGCYCWWTDNQTHEYCVWMTTNGILMYEDVTEKKLYRVSFNQL